MTKAKTYTNSASFRRALEDRLSAFAKKEGMDIQTVRRHVAFDRLLARLFRKEATVAWALKGGYAMELRIESARATKDIDLALRDGRLLSANPEEQNRAIQEKLQEHASVDLGDHFRYLIGAPSIDIDGAPYGGARFSVDSLMDDRSFVRFHLDVGVGDVWMEPLDAIGTGDWLAFAGIPATSVLAISKEQQFAEKLHTYTVPRSDRQNSRVKDLVDMALLVQSKMLDRQKVAQVIRATFDRRKTHEVPLVLSAPPKDWEKPFAALATECGISESYLTAFEAVDDFLKNLRK